MDEKFDENGTYTVEELKEHCAKMMLRENITAEEFDHYSDSYERLCSMKSNEEKSLKSLQLQERQIKAAEKANKMPIIAAIITALGGLGGVIIGKKIDYNADMDYLDRSVEHEKTDNVLRNDRKQRRPKHARDGK